MEDQVYTSPQATITRSTARLLDREFSVADIAEVYSYDERAKALRWAKVGVICFIPALLMMVLTGYRPGLIPALIGTIGYTCLLAGGGALLVYKFRPTLGTGLVVTKTDGSSEIIKGLERQEIERIVAAFGGLFKEEAPPS